MFFLWSKMFMWQIYRTKTIIASRMSHVEMYMSQKSKYKKDSAINYLEIAS